MGVERRTGNKCLGFECHDEYFGLFFVWIGGPHLEAFFVSKRSDDGAASTKREDNSNNDAWKGGLELGVWKSLGTTANLYGLSMTTADH